MQRHLWLPLVAILMLAAFGCAKPEPAVWVPPRIDLREYGTLGLVEFRCPQGLGPLATQQFVASLHAAQAGIPVLELGPLARVLAGAEAGASVGADGRPALGPDGVRAIAEKYGVDVLVVGDLLVESPRPSFSIRSFTEANASAEILGTLTTRFLDGRSGATIWSDQARGSRNVAHLDVAMGQRPQFGAVDPQGEHAQLVSWLVGRVTGDFRGYWARP
jgi:hypothetical protein